MWAAHERTYPFLFSLIALLALAELGLTVYLISTGNSIDYFVSGRYHALLITFCTLSSWTTLFAGAYVLWSFYGGGQVLAGVASSIFWLLITTIAWAITSGIMSWARTGGSCPGRPSIHKCRQSLTVSALGYAEMCILSITLLLTLGQTLFSWKKTRDWSRISQSMKNSSA